MERGLAGCVVEVGSGSEARVSVARGSPQRGEAHALPTLSLGLQLEPATGHCIPADPGLGVKGNLLPWEGGPKATGMRAGEQ